jgi:hypothetical protein
MNNKTCSGRNKLNITIGYNKMKFSLKCKTAFNNLNLDVKVSKLI